jgi:hypothetical protein
LLEKLNRVKLSEKERANLEPAKQEALEYVEMLRKIIDDKSILHQLKRTQAEAIVQEISKQRDELDEKLKQEREKTRQESIYAFNNI